MGNDERLPDAASYLACGSALGFYQLPDETYRVSRRLFRGILVDCFSEQPIVLRLPKGFKIPPTAGFLLAFEKQRLKSCLANRRRTLQWM